MIPFRTKEDLISTLSLLWGRIIATPEIMARISRARIIVRFRFSDFETALYLDAKTDEPKYYWDPEEDVQPDVEMILSSETSHEFWMEQLNVPLAIATRRIIAKGSVQKALKLLPALKPAFALYPDVLREMGKEDLLEGPAKPSRKRWFPMLRRRRKQNLDLSVLPDFPMTFAEKGAERDRNPAQGDVDEVTEAGLLESMHRIRSFEEHLSQAFREGKLPTEAIHLSIGQEAIAAAVCMNLRATDYLNTTHRGHGHIIAKGADLELMMAEIYGKSAGQCGGKGGSMHVTDGNLSILGANGIVGAGYLLAMGAGFSVKQQGRSDISVVIAGDGSVNQGMFHEAANMAGLFHLPVLFVIENNLYGEFTPVERHSAVPEVYRRAAAYGIAAQRLDGNDPAGLSAAIRRITQEIRETGEPQLVELMTYRWHGHMEGEPELYRSVEEKERFKQDDPIPRLEKEMLASGVIDEPGIERIREDARNEVQAAVQFALEAPRPEQSALMTDVYAPDDASLFTGTFREPVDGCREISVSQAVNEAIAEEMAADDKVFLWGEDVTLGGYFNVAEGLVDRFGTQRVVDTPISENAIVGGAVGAAMTGMRPIAEILFGDFLTCCMDPILNQAAKLRYMTGGQVSVPLTIRTPVGTGIGMAAQHSQSMERFFFGVPGLIVVAPSDAYTTKGLLKSAIRSDNPVLFFEHKLLYPDPGKVPDGDYVLPLGKARVVKQGKDVTIVSHLLGVSISLDAAGILEEAGIDAEVVDLATLYPMDSKTILESVAKTGRLVALEEGTCTGGIGAEVIARVSIAGNDLLKAPPLRIGAPECPVPYAKNIENAMLPDPQGVAERITNALR